MLLAHRRRARRHANRQLPIHDGARQVHLPTRVQRLVQRLGALIHLRLIRPDHAKRQQREPRFRKHGEQVRPRAQFAVERRAEVHAALDMRAQTAHAVAAQDEPQLEGAEAAAERDLPVAVVGDEVRVGELVAQVRGLDAEGRDEVGAGPHPHGGAVKRREQPLVRVEIEGVEVGERRRKVLVFFEDERGAGKRGVDVHPDFTRRGLRSSSSSRIAVGGGSGGGSGLEVGRQSGRDAGKVVDGADVRRAERRRDIKRLEPFGAELVELGLQCRARHGVAAGLVDGDRVEAHANDLRRLLRARVRAGAAQRHELAAVLPQLLLFLLAIRQVRGDLRQVLVAGGDHDGEDGLGGAAVQHAAAVRRAAAQVALGQRERFRQPVHDNRLELGDGRGADPVEMRAVEGVGPHLGNVGRVRGRAGEEGHEARVRPVRDAGHDLGLDVGGDGLHGLALERRGVGEQRPQVAGLHVGEDGAGRDRFIVVGDWKKSVC